MSPDNPPKLYNFAILVVESEAGYESMANLFKEKGSIPSTVTLTGPNGSLFYFFSLPPGMQRKNVQLAPHVTLRTDGRYDDLLPPDILAGVEATIEKKQ